MPPDLQQLFAERILELEELHPGFDDHGSSVFRVRTAREDVVVRAFRADDLADPFWGCLNALFGIDPLVESEAVAIYALLAAASPIRVPLLKRTGIVDGRVWLVVEHMRGTPLARFDELSDGGLVAFGSSLAHIHRRRFDTLGNPSGSMRYPPAEFPRRLAEVIRRHAAVDAPHAGVVDEMCAAAAELPPPAEGALVLGDIFPPQFLHADGAVVALIDIDAYVVGPRELDFVCLEYFVDERAAALIARGYRDVGPLPSLEQVRRVYRFFFWVLTMNPGALDYDRWMTWPTAFD